MAFQGGINTSKFGFSVKKGDVALPPVNTVAPVISGTTTVGSTLSCTAGTWTGTLPITYTYQWKRGGVDIGGATNNTYLLVTADASTNITCVVTGTNVAGASSATSNTLSIAALTPAQILGVNLYDWFDFTDSATLALTGVRVDSITSKASVRQFTSTGANRPQIVANQINGLQVARFDGISEFMSVPASTALYNFLHNQSSGGMVMVVAKIADANPDNAQWFLNNDGGSGTRVGYFLLYDDRSSLLRNNTVRSGCTTGAGSSVLNASADNFYGTQQYNVLTDILDPNNATASNRSKLSVNFGAVTQNNAMTLAASNANATDNFTLGKTSNASTLYLKGDMVEIIISQNQPTPTQLTQLQTYLTSKYGAFPVI